LAASALLLLSTLGLALLQDWAVLLLITSAMHCMSTACYQAPLGVLVASLPCLFPVVNFELKELK
jgi:hypothetical protein